jgi:hypothetical protein
VSRPLAIVWRKFIRDPEKTFAGKAVHVHLEECIVSEVALKH